MSIFSRPFSATAVARVAAGAVALLALPAPGALAAHAVHAAKHHRGGGAPQAGVVLSATHHRLQLVDAQHRVSDAHVRSSHGLHRGAVVTISHARARVTRHVKTVMFLGRVVRSSSRHGVVLKLADGSRCKVTTKHRHGAEVTAALDELAPGQAVLVTVSSDARGDVALAIKLVDGKKDIGDSEKSASGTVTDDSGGGRFGIATDDGTALPFRDPHGLFEASGAGECDSVDVTYHAAPHGGGLVADTLEVTGSSQDDSCADQQGAAGDDPNGDPSGDGGDNPNEIDGIVTAIAPDDSSLTVDQEDGSDLVLIPVADPSELVGLRVGDDVAVIVDGNGVATEVDVADDSGDSPSDSG